nr:unnamed protein product [Callosobruchus chinensis]
MQLNTQEMVDMIYILEEYLKNSLLASRVYKERFPDRRHPDPRSFERVMDRFDRTGTVKYEKQERRKRVVNEDNEFDVLATVVEDPHSSTSEISHDLGIGQISVKRILTKNNYHPYHVQLNQALEGQDFENRMDFCNWGRARIQEGALFLIL